MSAYKQIIVFGVKVPNVLQLLCPFFPAKTSILHGDGAGGEAVNPFSPKLALSAGTTLNIYMVQYGLY